MRIAPKPPGSSAHAHVPTVAAVAAVALLAAVAGCSSGSGGGTESLKALRHMADATASKQVTYVDGVQVRKLRGVDAKRFTTIGDPASSVLNTYRAAPWEESLKLSQIDTAVDTSDAGHWDGTFDPAAITATLKKNGYTSGKQDGKEAWKAPDGSGPIFVITKDEIRYATEAKGFSPSDPGHGDSLADTEEYKLVADCMGEVYRADFNPLSTGKPVRLSALGQQADDAGKNTEVLCVAVKDQATADKLAAKLRAVVKDKAPRFAGTEVTVAKGDRPVVRASVPDTSSQRPGRLMVSDVQLWMAIGDM
nr:hypothetical protein OH826_10450 [Streptomyces sp. NBC_00899]WSX79684.1 hypothetical protein OH826_41060 [Streptomyces sp. NBC_00899]